MMSIELDPRYVTGLCEGIASFTYARNGSGLNLRFSMKVSENDRDLVMAIMRFFGAGNIYHSAPQSGRGKGGNWFYCVTSVPDLEKVVRHFDAYPMEGSRALAYKLWKQMHSLKKIPRHVDNAALFSLAGQLSSISKRRQQAAAIRTMRNHA